MIPVPTPPLTRPTTPTAVRKRATDDEMEGGYQIATDTSDGDRLCTLGFNTERDGVKGFVTAGHCTEGKDDWVGQEENIEFYQPDTDDNANLIGGKILRLCPHMKIARAAIYVVSQIALSSGWNQE